MWHKNPKGYLTFLGADGGGGGASRSDSLDKGGPLHDIRPDSSAEPFVTSLLPATIERRAALSDGRWRTCGHYDSESAEMAKD